MDAINDALEFFGITDINSITIETVRTLAKKLKRICHPDKSGTNDTEKFNVCLSLF